MVGRAVLAGVAVGTVVLGCTPGASALATDDARGRGDGATTRRVSVGPDARQGNERSVVPSISGDGRLVAFESDASNLVAGDTNQDTDVFVRDLQTRVTRRVSLGPAGQQGNDGSFFPRVSGSGRYVAFVSSASNLVPGDTNGARDVFVRDLQDRVTVRVSVGDAEQQAGTASFAPSISADGRFVAFFSGAANLVGGDSNGATDVFVRDLQDDATVRVSVGAGGQQANGDSGVPAISADGTAVAFESEASDLVAADSNDTTDVFVRDVQAGTTRRVSVGPGGQQADGSSASGSVAVSGDGQLVAFASRASNLVGGDTNEARDVFVRDLDAGSTRRVSVGPGGRQGNRSSDGRGLALSTDGRFVAFASAATNLVDGDTNQARDVFLRDLQAASTQRVSVGPGGREGNRGGFFAALSRRARIVAFGSSSSNLVRGDTNGVNDVFVRDR